jgi:hypothetical protein
MVDGGENSQRKRLSRSAFSSCDISQTRTDIEHPSGDNVHDMEQNNVSQYHLDKVEL